MLKSEFIIIQRHPLTQNISVSHHADADARFVAIELNAKGLTANNYQEFILIEVTYGGNVYPAPEVSSKLDGLRLLRWVQGLV